MGSNIVYPCLELYYHFYPIVWQEPYFLPIWIRYYGKHFPKATYVLHHHRNDSETPPDLPHFPGISYKYIELYGEPHGFSVMWVAHMVSVYQMRFLRSGIIHKQTVRMSHYAMRCIIGYKCVLFSDIDEYIIPRLDKYPSGLIGYVASFQNNSQLPHTRVVGFEICHISEGMNDKQAPLEGPIKWDESIMQQRHFWSRHHRYDKPLLSKVLKPCLADTAEKLLALS